MAELSGPLIDKPFTDEQFRRLSDGDGIVQDYTGTSYALTLPTSTNNATLGPGQSKVAGFGHEIAAGQNHTVTIPTSSNASKGRTDIIGVAYDASYDTEPGPCRLVRIAGTEGSDERPNVDMQPPGVQVMPLYAITRKSGQALNQAAVVDLRRWAAVPVFAAVGASPFGGAPIGTMLFRGTTMHIRYRNDSTGAPDWFQADLSDLASLPWNRIAPASSTGSLGSVPNGSGWTSADMSSEAVIRGNDIELDLRLRRAVNQSDRVDGDGVFIDERKVFVLSPNVAPRNTIPFTGVYRIASGDYLGCTGTINPDGSVVLRNGVRNNNLVGHASVVCLIVTARYTR